MFIYSYVSVLGVASAQFNSNPAVSELNGAATLSWQVPAGGLGTGSSLYTINPAGTFAFILTSGGMFIPSSNYAGRIEFSGNYTSRNITFTLRNISSAYAGTYGCGNGAVTDVISDCGQMLVVLGKPTKPPRPSPSTTPVYTKQVSLTCTSTSTSLPIGHGLLLTYKWERDGIIVTPDPGTSFTFTFTVNSRNTHIFRCRAVESRGLESDWSDVYRMEPEYGPYQESLTPPGLSYTVRENQDAVSPISCSANCKPACTYRWEKNGTIVSNTAVLNLGQSLRSQTGSYRCRGINKHDSVYTSSVSVNVQYAASITEFTLNSVAGPVTVSEGDTVTLKCRVDSNPLSTIRLLNGTQVLKSEDNSLSETSISHITCRQRGNYYCGARNSIGPDAVSAVKLAVECSPRPDETFPVKYQFASRLGSSVTLWMSVLSYPVPTFTWSTSNSSFQDLSGSLSVLSDISVNISLTLTSLRREDFESYNLTLTNGVGENTIITFEAVPQGPPDLPTDVQVREITPNSALVSWTRGFNGGDSQYFTVSYSEDNTTWQNSSEIEEKETIDYYDVTLSSLNPSTSYIVRVIAVNTFGDSWYTEAVLLVTDAILVSPDNSGLVGGVVGGCAALLLLALVGGGIYMYRRKKGAKDQRNGTSRGRSRDDVGMEESSGEVDTRVGVPSGGATGGATGGASDVYAVVTKKPKPELYAQVKPKKAAKPVDKKKDKENKGDVYEITSSGQFLVDADANTYANAGFVGDDHNSDETAGQAPPTGRDADGCLYVGIDFSNQKPRTVIIGEEKNKYVHIEFGKVGASLPPDNDDEEEKKKDTASK